MTNTWLGICNEWEVYCDGCGMAAGRAPSEAGAEKAMPPGWKVVGYGYLREHYCDECRSKGA